MHGGNRRGGVGLGVGETVDSGLVVDEVGSAEGSGVGDTVGAGVGLFVGWLVGGTDGGEVASGQHPRRRSLVIVQVEASSKRRQRSW